MITACVALPIPSEVAEVLEKAQEGLHAGELLPREAFFVTVVDLGEVSAGDLRTIEGALHEVRQSPFYVKVSGVGTQGSDPRIVHAETDRAPGMENLHSQVGRALRKAGIPLEISRLAPRITIAEFPEMGQHDMRHIMSFLSRREGMEAGRFPATDFQLIAMHDTEEGLMQETVATYQLRL